MHSLCHESREKTTRRGTTLASIEGKEISYSSSVSKTVIWTPGKNGILTRPSSLVCYCPPLGARLGGPATGRDVPGCVERDRYDGAYHSCTAQTVLCSNDKRERLEEVEHIDRPTGTEHTFEQPAIGTHFKIQHLLRSGGDEIALQSESA